VWNWYVGNADLAPWTSQLGTVDSVIWQSGLDSQEKSILQNSQIVTWTSIFGKVELGSRQSELTK